MDIYQMAGSLILGSRLKRLGERLYSDISQLYRRQNIPFEPSWFPLFYLLDKTPALSMSEIADALDITQSAVSQIYKNLQVRGYLESHQSREDKRSKCLALTQSGRELLNEIKPLWNIIEEATEELLQDGPQSSQLLNGLSEMEQSLDIHSLAARLETRLDRQIVLQNLTWEEYSSKWQKEYQILLESWMKNTGEFIDPSWIYEPERHSKTDGCSIALVIQESRPVALAIQEDQDDSRTVLCLYLKEEWQNRNLEDRMIKELLDFQSANEITISLGEQQRNFLKPLLNNHFQLYRPDSTKRDSLLHFKYTIKTGVKHNE